MYTQCRGCGEKFILEVEQLVHARGQVRCNMCGTVFDAIQTLSAQKPSEDEDLLLHDFDNAPPLLTQVYDMDIEPDEEVLQVLNDILPENLMEAPDENEVVLTENIGHEAVIEAVDETPEADEAPMFAERAPEKPKAKTSGGGLWFAMSLAMVLLLGWQTVSALQSGRLVLPEKPWSQKLCQTVGCAQSAQQVDLSAISLLSRNIRPHPGRDAALLISASMTNANPDNLMFPVLEIKLSDLNGEVVAMRRFKPEEYLTPEIVATGFKSNTLVPIRLEINSPSEEAVAFELGFAQP